MGFHATDEFTAFIINTVAMESMKIEIIIFIRMYLKMKITGFKGFVNIF